jgi:hypothetical protein
VTATTAAVAASDDSKGRAHLYDLANGDDALGRPRRLALVVAQLLAGEHEQPLLPVPNDAPLVQCTTNAAERSTKTTGKSKDHELRSRYSRSYKHDTRHTSANTSVNTSVNTNTRENTAINTSTRNRTRGDLLDKEALLENELRLVAELDELRAHTQQLLRAHVAHDPRML